MPDLTHNANTLFAIGDEDHETRLDLFVHESIRQVPGTVQSCRRGARQIRRRSGTARGPVPGVHTMS